jgi:tetratricopeptide (TPR) repeat protein
MMFPLRRPRLAPLALLACVYGAAAWGEETDDAFRKGRRLIDEGYSRADAESLSSARALFIELAERPELAPAARYFAGLAYYRLFELSERRGERTPKLMIHLDHALNQLREVVRLDRNHAEALALLAACYARKATYFPFGVERLAPVIREQFKTARGLAPDSPRIVLLESLGIYRAPQVFESEPQQALAGFERAARMFGEAVPGAARVPDWGRAEAQAWIGVVHLDAGRSGQARQAFEAALRIDPDYDWVKSDLLAQLDEAPDEPE